MLRHLPGQHVVHISSGTETQIRRQLNPDLYELSNGWYVTGTALEKSYIVVEPRRPLTLFLVEYAAVVVLICAVGMMVARCGK